ncbi:hypothetical protein FOA52_004884 [Chlamydomonas sp. UWO 241]|nr:hypothetical protein FOA52_004884 [Chlamydomonas sp. UWO 241]
MLIPMRHAAQATDASPLYSLTERVVASALEQAGCSGRHEVSWVHTNPGLPGFVAASRAAQVSGLAYHDCDLYICLHPSFGPWFAMRAVVSFDADFEGASPQLLLADPIPPPARAQLLATVKALLAPGGAPNGWLDWVEFRDAIGAALGAQGHRYPEAMLRYHYTSDVGCLT